MRGRARGVVSGHGLVWALAGLGAAMAACGGSEPATSSTTEAVSTGSSTGSGSTTGADGSSDGASTTWVIPDFGPPPPSQSATCATYVACASELGVDELDAIEQMYGWDGTCWDGDAAQASACTTTCEQELSTLVMGLEAMGEPVPEVCAPPAYVPWAEIEAMLEANCVTGCHEPGGEDSSLDLSDGAYYAIYQVASDQSDLYLVDPGDHEQSYLWHKVNGSQGGAGGGGARMPKGAAPLTAEQIDALADWIDGGAAMF